MPALDGDHVTAIRVQERLEVSRMGKATIATAHDDPVVLRAIARDLRSRWRVASAVGEGATSVNLAHQYLAMT